MGKFCNVELEESDDRCEKFKLVLNPESLGVEGIIGDDVIGLDELKLGILLDDSFEEDDLSAS